MSSERTSLPSADTPRTCWGLIFAVWSIPAAIETVQRYLMMSREGGVTFGALILMSAAVWLPWMLATPFVLGLARRLPIRTPHRGRAIAVHLAVSFGFAVVYGAWVTAADGLLRTAEPWSWATYIERLGRGFTGIWFFTLIVYGVLVGLGMGLELRRRYRRQELEASRLAERTARLEQRLAEAQLTALRRELQPHFLFNTLHAISALVDQDPAAARAMLARLSDLLRLTLDAGHKPLVPLHEEVDLVERYLDIERIRLGDRLTVEYAVDDETLAAQVPSLLLQPLVENAIRHGIEPLARPGRIEIAAHRDNGALRLVVSDDGAGLGDEDGEREGIGLANTRERLAQLYGDRGRLELQDRDEGGVEVAVTVPLS